MITLFSSESSDQVSSFDISYELKKQLWTEIVKEKEEITAWHINRNAIKLGFLLQKRLIKLSTNSHLFVNCVLVYKFYQKNINNYPIFSFFAIKKEIKQYNIMFLDDDWPLAPQTWSCRCIFWIITSIFKKLSVISHFVAGPAIWLVLLTFSRVQ